MVSKSKQPDLPADAPVVPAHDVVVTRALDVASIPVPDAPDDVDATQPKVATMSGIPLAANGFTLAYGLYAYLLPFALYAAWIGLAAWDLSRRDDLSTAASVGWLLVVLVVPFVGPIAYFLAGRSRIPAHIRWTLVAGGFGAYLLAFAIGAVLGGIV